MKSIIQVYKNAFGGLSQAAWMLSLVMLINRSGSMVLPFMALYLKIHLGFSVAQAGTILSLFGVGSLVGSFLGGWLNDKIGHFKVQLISLVGGGVLFLLVLQYQTPLQVGIGFFVLAMVADMLRPANASSVAFYAKPENITRAFSLNRMAINLGFSVGPAVGGFLAAISYRWLFIADGATCIAAGLFFYFYFKNRKGNAPPPAQTQTQNQTATSPYKDPFFIAFALLVCGFAIVFFQLFMTLPLYYRDVYQMPESTIGWLLALNGIIVFGVEMVAVHLIGNKIKPGILIALGTLLTGLSFVMLNLFSATPVLYASMVLLSFAEIAAMPFMATYVVQQSNNTNRGAYMGLYTIAYSAAHILSPYLSTRIIQAYNYQTLWWVSGIFSVAVALGFWLLMVVRKTKMD